LSEEQRKRFVLVDNHIPGMSGDFDFDILANEWELPELEELGFSLDDLGIDATPIEGLTDPDDVPEPPDEPVTRLGDLWVMGDHRLLCGDSTVAGDVERVMEGEKADLCFTSPPYLMQRTYDGNMSSDWDNLMQGVFGCIEYAASDKMQILVNLGLVHEKNEWLPYWTHWCDWMREQGWRRFGLYAWDQGFGLPGNWNGRFAPAFELVFHFNKKAAHPNKWVLKKPGNVGARKHGQSSFREKDGTLKAFTNPGASRQRRKIPDSVIKVDRNENTINEQIAEQEEYFMPDSMVRVNRQSGGVGHPAPFPVKFPEYFIKSWHGLVYEPFSGSGTTIIACEQLNRRCRAIEISPAYCDVAVRRWCDFTGKDAVRQDGAKWSDLANA
jgi:DNA modification methylase